MEASSHFSFSAILNKIQNGRQSRQGYSVTQCFFVWFLWSWCHFRGFLAHWVHWRGLRTSLRSTYHVMEKCHMFQVIVKQNISHIMPSLVVPSAQFFSKARVYDELYILDMIRNNRITLIKKTFFVRIITKYIYHYTKRSHDQVCVIVKLSQSTTDCGSLTHQQGF